MREIEIKARVADKVVLLQTLQEKGIDLSEPIEQHDVVYGWPGIADNAPNSIWLRVRTENSVKHIFTLKRSVVGGLDSIEHETAVENPAEMTEIIKQLGYELYSDLTKIRQKGRAGDIEICFDTVRGIGDFVEAERMMEADSDHDLVTAELWQFFDKLGIAKEDEVHEGYDVLERRSRGL